MCNAFTGLTHSPITNDWVSLEGKLAELACLCDLRKSHCHLEIETPIIGIDQLRPTPSRLLSRDYLVDPIRHGS